MKRFKSFAIVTFAIAFLFTLHSCGNDDETVNETKKVENTSWNSVEFNSHQTNSLFADKTESNTIILSKVQQLNGLRYTVDENVESNDVSVNLCEKSGHTNDGLMSLLFTSDKCQIKVTTLQSVYKAKRTKTEKIYKFEEGSYTVNTGGNHYEGITVYNYGVYRADKILFIPLDGKGCAVVETATKYTDKKIENSNVEESTILADYSISDNKITFTCPDKKTMIGTLSADGQSISIASNPFVSTIKSFKK